MSFSPEILSQLNTSHDQLLEVLRADVGEIFTTMVGIDPDPHLQSQAVDTSYQSCVSAIICLSGTYFGTVSVHLPAEVAMRVAGSMLGMEIDAVNADVIDAVGEVANMIAGSFKQHIVFDGSEMRISTPTVLPKDEHFRRPDAARDTLAVLFGTNDGSFWVAVHLEQ